MHGLHQYHQSPRSLLIQPFHPCKRIFKYNNRFERIQIGQNAVFTRKKHVFRYESICRFLENIFRPSIICWALEPTLTAYDIIFIALWASCVANMSSVRPTHQLLILFLCRAIFGSRIPWAACAT
jgi:hypothetical protein